jgi:hypothetical protein
MIPKNKMEIGFWYKGFCRNNYVAFWDGENFNISDISSDNLETIEHFEDVKENRKDGFVPIEKIERKK